MSETMSLVYLRKTGSVLTYVTRRSVPSDIEQIGTLDKEQLDALKAKELEVIVGTKLVINHELDASFQTTKFEIPADQLDVLIAKLDSNVTYEPRAYFVKEDGTTASVDIAAATVPVTSSSNIKVKTPHPVPVGTKVWLRIHGQNGSQIGGIQPSAPNSPSGDEAEIFLQTLTSGTYLVLAAVAGFKPVAKEFTVP